MSAYYTATCPGCQRIVAACVDEPQYVKANAKLVAEWIRDGLSMARVETLFGVKMGGCLCEPNPRTKKRASRKAPLPLTPDSAAEARSEHAPSHPKTQTSVSLLPDQTARET